MKFKDIAIKNFKVNLRKYLSYFLCSSFSIMLFFMYSTLLFNKSITSGEDKQIINIIFYMSLTVIALFSIFFINYAHSAFVKSRYKEFGIYMSLGMTKKDIRKIIVIENLLIIVSSLVAGIVSGFIFSRLFQMIVASILDIENISYSFNFFSFVITIVLFSFIFLLVLVLNRFATNKLEINELLKKSRHNEAEIKSKIVPTVIGVVILVISLTSFIIISTYEKLNSNFAIVIPNILVIFVGVYMTISYMWLTLLSIIKNNKKSYYKNILAVTEITSKFQQNKRIIFVLSILSSMIVFFVASPFSLYSLSERISGQNQPYDIEYVSIDKTNTIDSKEIDRIIKNSETKLTKQSYIEFLSYAFKNEAKATDILGKKPVIPQSVYNKLTNSEISVPKGVVYNAISNWQPGTFGIEKGSIITLFDDNLSINYTVSESKHIPWVSSGNSFPSNSGLIMNDEDYASLKAKTSADSIGFYHTFMFEDWKKTSSTIDAIKDAVNKVNVTEKQKANSELYTIISRLQVYGILKRAYSMFMFVTVIMGLLFFIAAGSVLFFKQYTEIEGAKQRYFKMFKIGITKKEAKKIITKELVVTFFTPLIFGSIMGYSFIFFMTHLVGGQDVMLSFMKNATKVVLAYFVFQALFCAVTRRKYVNEVLDKF